MNFVGFGTRFRAGKGRLWPTPGSAADRTKVAVGVMRVGNGFGILWGGDGAVGRCKGGGVMEVWNREGSGAGAFRGRDLAVLRWVRILTLAGRFGFLGRGLTCGEIGGKVQVWR